MGGIFSAYASSQVAFSHPPSFGHPTPSNSRGSGGPSGAEEDATLGVAVRDRKPPTLFAHMEAHFGFYGYTYGCK